MVRIPDGAQRAHDEAEAAGQPGYIDPDSGLFVMTRGHHLQRGHCCDSGCRHCPYGDVSAEEESP